MMGEMFKAWTPFIHPTYGEIEIGGWRTFTTRLPQPFQLPELVHRNASLVIFLARHAPEVELEVLEKKKLAKDLTRIRIRLANNHALDYGPEALQQGLELLQQQVDPDHGKYQADHPAARQPIVHFVLPAAADPAC